MLKNLLIVEAESKFDEEDLSTEHDQPKKDTWIFAADEHQRGKASTEAQTGQGEETAYGLNNAAAKGGRETAKRRAFAKEERF